MGRERKYDFSTVVLSIIIISIFISGVYLMYRYVIENNTGNSGFQEFMPTIEEVSVTNTIDTTEERIATNETKRDTQKMYDELNEKLNSNSTITKTKTVDNEKAYFYNQLDETGKKIYNILERNSDNLKTGTYTIQLGSTFNDLLHKENGKEILNNAYQDAWDAFFNDKPEIFYINVRKMYLYTKTITTGSNTKYENSIGNINGNYFADGFTSEEQIRSAVKNVESVKNQILATVNGNSIYDAVLKIHNWLVDNVEYDTTLNRTNTHNVYGTLIEKNVVCEGYARTFKYLLDCANIPCVVVSGTGNNGSATEDHAWNYVKIDNQWYAVDVTWDDPIIMGAAVSTDKYKYRYFLKGYSQFRENHIASGKFTQNGKTFTYPQLSNNDYEK